MAKFAIDAMMDAALSYLDTNAVRLHVCTTQPANYAGIAAVELAIVTIDGTDMTLADGDTSGRKLTVAQQADIEVLVTGTAQHIALSNGSNTLYYVTTCTSQALTDGNTVTVPAWDIEIADPS